MEIFSDANGISIYFPYSENFPWINPADPNNNTINGNLVTIVNADREDDSAPGNEPYSCSGNPREPVSEDNQTICYKTVTVNDDYAERIATHIIGIGAEPARIMDLVDPPSIGNVIYIGEVKCTKQYDKLISWSNGGGSELRFIRGDGYLKQNDAGQITSPENTISVDMKRKDIRKGNWKTVYSIWDSNWESDNKQQVFGIYEEDNETSQTFSGSIQTTLKLAGGTTQIGPISYSMTVKSKDDIIRQLNWDRNSFFTYNKGGLNNGCGTRSGWTVYDCNLNVSYTMPQQ